jgi:hypothetical protein
MVNESYATLGTTSHECALTGISLRSRARAGAMNAVGYQPHLWVEGF